MDVKHRMIVLDATDIDAESALWAGLLGGTVVEDGERRRNVWVDGEWQLDVQLARASRTLPRMCRSRTAG